MTVLTPVYNGEKYLAECVESVLAQTYRNFEYVIVDNCSTDKTLEIAREYAQKDARIWVVTNERHVGVIENHNIAFRHVSAESKYCKVVSADDWIYPQCLRLLVEVGERNPTAGIIGSYQQRSNRIMWKGVSRNAELVSGRQACRMTFLDDLTIFGPPTSTLYRSDLVRANTPFYSTSLPHADICAFYDYLDKSDFGFVHEVLSVERIHSEQTSTKPNDLYADLIADISNVLKYGRAYLEEDERAAVLHRYMKRYYSRLGGAVLKLKGKNFWEFHRSRMADLGIPISWVKVARAAVSEMLQEMKNPRIGFRKFGQALKRTIH